MGDVLTFNGVDGVTGKYLLSPASPDEVLQAARVTRPGAEHLGELRWWHRRATESTFGPREGIDPKDLAQTGWGVIFAHPADAEVREALRPLLELRRGQASLVDDRFYREFIGEGAYRPGESKQQFLARHGAGPGPADPRKVPYYLLLVGGPDAIPFAFQYQLDVQYAVGRLDLERPEDYAAYAESVVGAETSGAPRPRRAVFFGTRNHGDPATALSADGLVLPLAEHFRSRADGWEVETCVGEEAGKRRLAELVGGPSTPALLFTATHGVGFPPDHVRQRPHQGALLCQEWPGPGGPQLAIPEGQYFSGDDIGADADLQGLISFHFACFGGGTPQWDDYWRDGTDGRRQLASRSFVAAMPKRLLGHARGGALAVVGHVDRAWGYSFRWPQAGQQTEVYEDCLQRLLAGHPIGSAFEYFNERYAELSSDLSAALEDVEYGKLPDHLALASMWTANNDARGFAVLGDPAVRLPSFAEAAAPRDGPPRPTPIRLDEAAARGATPVADPAAVAPPPEAVDYGLLDGVRQARERLVASLDRLTGTLTSALARALEDVLVVDVATYVSDDLSAVDYDRATRTFGGDATLVARSRLGIDGDVLLAVPRQRGELDDALWALHLSMLEQARSARSELLKSAGTTLLGLLDAVGGR
jgi:hypothetical protein